MRHFKTIVMLVPILIAGCMSPQLPDTHRHVVNVHAAPWMIEDAPDARLVWVDAPPTDRLRNVVTNQNRTALAYILGKPWTHGSFQEHIQIKDLGSKKVYELEGIPFEWRPFSDLVWLNDRYLAFDRWTHPHYGRHFVVDFQRKELVLMVPFPDEFYLELEEKKQQEQPTKPRTVP